jgi:hypothetical protein
MITEFHDKFQQDLEHALIRDLKTYAKAEEELSEFKYYEVKLGEEKSGRKKLYYVLKSPTEYFSWQKYKVDSILGIRIKEGKLIKENLPKKVMSGERDIEIKLFYPPPSRIKIEKEEKELIKLTKIPSIKIDEIIELKKRIIPKLLKKEYLLQTQIITLKETTEERMNKILENVNKGIFTIDDVKLFIKIRDVAAFSETYEKIWEAYRWKLLIPILAGEERIVLIGLLNEKNKRYSSKQLKQEVQKLYPTKPIIYELAIESLLKDEFIIHHKSWLRDEYELTEKGRVAALLTHEIYQKIVKNTKRD